MDYTGNHAYSSGVAPTPDWCPWCSAPPYSYVFHLGSLCPRVRAIEYYDDGRIKKVYFFGDKDDDR